MNDDLQPAGREMDAWIERTIFGKEFHRMFTPDYSRNILFAFDVVEKIIQRHQGNITFELEHLSGTIGYNARFRIPPSHSDYSSADTAPLAICRAVKALEGQNA